jgi:hypothetical protein
MGSPRITVQDSGKVSAAAVVLKGLWSQPLDHQRSWCAGLPIEFLHVPELRKEARLRTLKSGRIVLPNGSSTISCTIRNLSAGGACLELASQVGIPDAFDLITGESNVRRPCRVAWRKANRMGVQFG